MKRLYKRSLPDGSTEVATISIESDAVTVAIRDPARRSKGKHVRCPLKHCKGGSPELEGRAQALKLQAEGFVFDKEEGDSSTVDDQALLYVIIRKKNIPDAVEYVTGYELPVGVSVTKMPAGGWRVHDSSNQELYLVDGCDSTSVLLMNSPLVAVALLLCNEALADLSYETTPGPAGTKVVSPQVMFALAQTLDPELTEFLIAKGITPPGVVKAHGVARAILL